MLRLAALGVAAIGLAALRQRGQAKKRRSKRDKEQPSRRRRAKQSEGDAAQPAPLPNAGAQTGQTDGAAAPPPPRENLLLAVAQLLLRLLLSLAATLALHYATGELEHWSPERWSSLPLRSVLISSLGLFVLTELLQREPAWRQHRQPHVNGSAGRAVTEAALAPAAAALQDFSGHWAKDREASDSMEEACQLMQMNALLRTAVGLIKGLRIRQGGGQFEMAVLSGILWFKVVESYPLDGSERSWKRRDLRRGKHMASVRALPSGALQMRLRWPEPFGGEGTDTYFCPDPDTLWVDSVLSVRGSTVKYRQVYHRQH